MIEATGQGKVREIILDHATGAAPAEEPARRQPDAPDLEDEDARRDYISRARFQVDEANKAIQRAHMVGAAKELRDRHPGIASFDLSSHGDSPAIVNAWDEAGEPVADPVIDAANRDVFRWRILEDFNTLMYKDEPISVIEPLAWRPA